MTKKIVDLSSYQADSLSYMKQLKKWGTDGIMVKLTEGTGYLSPKAGTQITNGFKAFNTVGVYHFFHGRGTAEAQYFLAWVKKMGLDKSTVLAIDVEAPDLPWKTTSQVNVFLRYLISHGYKNVITYGSGSWFNAGRINRFQLVDKSIWVAAYGVSQPGVANANAWQYTDNFHGVDASYDFDGVLIGTSSTSKTKPKKDSYWSDNGLYEVIAKKPVHIYSTPKFKGGHMRRSVLAKGSKVYAKAVKYGAVNRLMLDKDNYITANKKFVKLVRKSGGK
ncbi:autolysin (plasmid) [Secundilactobacillus paracollinoides]|uniref:GH25 family lysozyme n=1 Tax=Secundilactobacillus paracollinoides TaxID=240427 RepID=UPI00081A9F72|nr:GH25 family lysozyme [Secundilactobacillus paracollinoides]ANZ65563.1 autolysin [Secundilactobacillus paracollinoides]